VQLVALALVLHEALLALLRLGGRGKPRPYVLVL
jgi:hypothetical protein